MRLFTVTLFTLAFTTVFTTAAAWADEPQTRFPYAAFVAVDEGPVRSGPGESYYPVLNLKHGDAVEVWRHDPNGWCAIRPPEGSFSWVAGEFVDTTDGRTGTIVGRQVNSRVGTRFSELRDAIQLRLDEGELVTIVGHKLAADGASVDWYRILPPAGEFRWIEAKHVVRDPRELPTGKTVSFEEPVDAKAGDATRLVALDAEASPETVLGELETTLSQMVAAEPTAWHFDALEQRAEALVERADDALERSRVRLFLGKLARFRDIQRRYGAIAETRTQTAEIDRELVQAAPLPQTKAALDGTVDTTRYDGVGRLTQIVLRDVGGASYALTDDRGELRSYVVAAPGVNLRQYVGLDVGINGIKGFTGDQRLPQITAKRIDVLSSRTTSATTLRR
jgi:hypothetical protein